MDQHAKRAVTEGLRGRGVEVVTAFEDGRAELADALLLDRADTLGCVFFTQDDDFLVEAAARRGRGQRFTSIVYAHQLRVSTGRCIDDLELIAKTCELDELVGQVIYLPL